MKGHDMTTTDVLMITRVGQLGSGSGAGVRPGQAFEIAPPAAMLTNSLSELIDFAESCDGPVPAKLTAALRDAHRAADRWVKPADRKYIDTDD